MEIEKVKSAIEILLKEKQRIYAEDTNESIDILCNLAESVIKAQEVMPQKQKEELSETEQPSIGIYIQGFNRAIDLCTLSVAKNYIPKESLPSDYDSWIEGLDVEDFIEYAEKWHKSSGYVKKEDVLRCFDAEYKQWYPCNTDKDEKYATTVSLLQSFRQALEQMGENNGKS